MQTAMESIKQMVDVNTVVGDAVQTGDGGVIIPVSRVSFGFAAGGGEYGPISERVMQAITAATLAASPVARDAVAGSPTH